MLSQDLIDRMLEFRRARDWEKFHNLRTLSTSIVLEAAELAEHTQWTPDAQLDDVLARRKEHIEHEIADLVILLTYLATDLEIDIERAVGKKLLLNADKYPVDRARGSSRKYDEL